MHQIQQEELVYLVDLHHHPDMTIYWTDYVESTCRQNYTYFSSSDFLLTAYHLTALFTIPLSIFTFLTIIRVTPRKMKNLKIPMLITHAWSTNLDLMLTVYSAPLTFFPSAAGIPMGFLATLGVSPKWLAYLGQVSVISIQCDFSQRMPCPTLDFFEKNAYILLRGGELLPFVSISVGLLTIMFQSLFFSIHTVYHLNYVKNATVSDATKALQKRFLSYVVLQVTIPLTVLCSPIIYSLVADRYDYYNQTLNNMSMLFMASHCLLSTACTLFVIKPYREFVRNIIRGNRNYNANDLWATQIQPASQIIGSVSG
ncbi:hypothetical protein GCK72_019237 [Caenorhabditis remanei]|uniref:Serpentine Receptor, class H n=1 Tax=Caenorhabditis remanei TaxID=31234 RepID=A0A6A5GDY6_CAERE|nr:hypothetical protein GCK72_019237 [Caenorhabditis remanei]KAF1752682.1 hypothetical protein GCK72_019237 [Caenorhabditis remanei]